MSMLRLVAFGIASVLWMGCAMKPVLSHKEYETYCKIQGACEAYLRGKMMQYQQVGGVVVGVMPAPKAAALRQ